METKDVIFYAIETVTAAGVVATAIATWRSWGIQRQNAQIDAPTIIPDSIIFNRKRDDDFYSVNWSVDKEHTTKWAVLKVTHRPTWRPLLSIYKHGEYDVKTGTSNPYLIKKTWSRVFDPPISKSEIYLIGSSPSDVRLVFTLALKSAPKITSHFTIRIKIRD